MPLSNYAAQATLNSLFGKTSNFGALATRPTLYVALFTTAPANDGTGGTEVSATSTGYARVSTAPADWNAATLANPSVVSNVNPITFAKATGSWGTITSFGIYDAATAGNYLGGGTLTTQKSPTTGDTPQYDAGQLTASLT